MGNNIYFKLKDNDGNIKDLELDKEISCDEAEIWQGFNPSKERFEIKYIPKCISLSNQNIPVDQLRFAPRYQTKPVIYDNSKRLPLPFEITDHNIVLAKDLCRELNELNKIKINTKPKPLKTEILQLLNEIDENKYEMANKIKTQKQHIKDLEHQIKLLKRDNKGLQRNYCKVTTDLEQIKGERDYYESKYHKVRGYDIY